MRKGHEQGVSVGTELVFGQVLRSLRAKLGISQEELGFRSGYDRTYISMLERGKKSPSLRTLFRLAHELGTRPSTILRRIEEALGRPAK